MTKWRYICHLCVLDFGKGKVADLPLGLLDSRCEDAFGYQDCQILRYTLFGWFIPWWRSNFGLQAKMGKQYILLGSICFEALGELTWYPIQAISYPLFLLASFEASSPQHGCTHSLTSCFITVIWKTSLWLLGEIRGSLLRRFSGLEISTFTAYVLRNEGC